MRWRKENSGRVVTELHSLNKRVLEFAIESELGEFSEHRNIVSNGDGNFAKRAGGFPPIAVEEFAGEKALICTCFGVSEERLKI
jgi:hypothetical protein